MVDIPTRLHFFPHRRAFSRVGNGGFPFLVKLVVILCERSISPGPAPLLAPELGARGGTSSHIRPRARRASSSPGSVNAPRREPCPPPPPSSAADWGSACRCTSTPCANSSFAVRHRPPDLDPPVLGLPELARDAPGPSEAARAVPRVTHPHPSVARARPPPTLAEPERPAADPVIVPQQTRGSTSSGPARASPSPTGTRSGRRRCARRWTRSTPSVRRTTRVSWSPSSRVSPSEGERRPFPRGGPGWGPG